MRAVARLLSPSSSRRLLEGTLLLLTELSLKSDTTQKAKEDYEYVEQRVTMSSRTHWLRRETICAPTCLISPSISTVGVSHRLPSLGVCVTRGGGSWLVKSGCQAQARPDQRPEASGWGGYSAVLLSVTLTDPT